MPNDNTVTTVTSLTTSKHNVEHPADEIGVFVGIDRLPEETAAAIRNRIWDVFVHKANASYGGLVNGMNRELGYIQDPAIVFSLASGVRMEDGPRIDVSQTCITVYSTWGIYKTPVIELTIDIFGNSLNPIYDYYARYISDVVTIINANSVVFTAALADSSHTYTLASALVPKSSIILSTSEPVTSQHHNMKHALAVPGSVVFDSTILTTEKIFRGADWDTQTVLTLPADEAEYWVDYDWGHIIFGLTNPHGFNVRYMYNDFPLTVSMLPIELYEFSDSGVQNAMYEQAPDTEGAYDKDIITRQFAGYVNQILLTARHFWGGDVIRNTPLAANDEHTDVVDDLNLSDPDLVQFTSSAPHKLNHSKAREQI